MAFASVVRSELRFALWGWTASYRLHFGFYSQVTPLQVERCGEWASQLDLGGFYTLDGVKKLRAVQSVLVSVVSTELGTGGRLQHLLLIPDAVGHGDDSFEPVPSAGQSIQLEWVTSNRGRGRNGRTFFPYLGRGVYVSPSLDAVNDAAALYIESLCSSFAFETPNVVGGELVVRTRQYDKVAADFHDSARVEDVTVRRATFAHQRRRVEYRKPYSPGP